jgi:hypothetical protein
MIGINDEIDLALKFYETAIKNFKASGSQVRKDNEGVNINGRLVMMPDDMKHPHHIVSDSYEASELPDAPVITKVRGEGADVHPELQ